MTLFTKQPGAGSGGATEQERHLPQRLFELSLDLEAPHHAQLVFAASELIEQQAEEIKRLKQASRDAAREEKRT